MSIKAAADRLRNIAAHLSVSTGPAADVLLELIRAAQAAGVQFSVQVTLSNSHRQDQQISVEAFGSELRWRSGNSPRSLLVPPAKARDVEALTEFLVEQLKAHDRSPLATDRPSAAPSSTDRRSAGR